MLFYFSRFDPLIYYTVILGQSQYDRDDADTLPLPHPYYPEEGISFSRAFGSLATNASSEGTGDDGASSRTAVSHGRPSSESRWYDETPPRDRWLLGGSVRRPPPASSPSSAAGGDDADDGGIPRIVNKIYFQRGAGFPDVDGMSSDLLEAHRSWGDMNPGYSVRYFDLRLARGYLRRHYHPAFLRAFDCLEAFASKSYLFRMTLLYREGGWHSDWKQTCLQRNLLHNLTSSTDNDDYDNNDDGTTIDFFAARDHDNFSNDTGVDHLCVQNSFVGSRPGHPVVGAFLERLLINVRTSRYGGRGPGLRGPLDATGPCLLGLAVRDANEAARDDNGTRFTDIAGRYEKGTSGLGYIRWKGTDAVQHKCADCGRNQNWGDDGNNYNKLYDARGYYCEDAASLFITTAEGH